jgi:multidrug efflux pump subunit AcrA (membrane-fusion protein)
MKKTIIIVLVLAAVGSLVFLSLQFKGGMPAAQASQPTPLPPVRAKSGIVAEGVVTPQQEITLSYASSGIIHEVRVAEGDQVQAGDVLVVPDNLAELQSMVEANRQALASAQKQYEQLMAAAPLTRANAQLALIQAQKDLDDAKDDTDSKLYQRASQETIDIARARLIVSNEELDKAEDIFNRVEWRGAEDVEYAAGLDQLAKARQLQLQAEYNLNYVQGLPEPLDIEEVDTKLTVSQAKLLVAQADWEWVKDGPNDPATVAAQAKVASAQATLDASEAALLHAVVRAPFAGTVVEVKVKPGQLAGPGTVLLTLADLSDLRVETTDLDELDVAQVKVGQPATVTVDGLEGTEIVAQVIQIADKSTQNSGDVVYKVTLRLVEPPEGLRWGMSTSVQILP